jgi:hypothetical protein
MIEDGAVTIDRLFSTGPGRGGTATQLVARRSVRPRPYHSGQVLNCELTRGIEPRT